MAMCTLQPVQWGKKYFTFLAQPPIMIQFMCGRPLEGFRAKGYRRSRVDKGSLDWTTGLDFDLIFFYLNLNFVVHIIEIRTMRLLLDSLCTAGAAQADAELSIKLA